MSVERKQRMFQVLDAALELSVEERAAFLDRECGQDTPLRREVEALLDTEVDGGLLAEPAFSIHAEDAAVGRRIGPYQLVQLLDRGGMGAVYLAEREDFEQRVALKLIRRGLDADELLVRRFQNERQILARLDHPNIARLLDGGATEDRLPYFVMEVVDGEPIDRYCRDRELSVGARLRLFRKVCAAVQFAHQNLVIHRDLKPGNILITEGGEPKLLDFGIAKLLDDSLTASPVQTELGQGPMTPRYASPEQIRLEPVTTASDVYSLGVLLYELLTGLDPYDVRGRRGDEVARAVCEQEPERPSTAVRRRTAETEVGESQRLRRQLAGDLDSIVLKAMRKEPHERYASAEQLSDDVRRHLEGMPVDAQTGSFRYRAGKFVRRHRLGMGVAAGFLVLIVGFSILSTVLWRNAERQRQRQEAVLDILGIFTDAANPDKASEQQLTADEALQLGQEAARAQLASKEPEVRLYVAKELGKLLHILGAYNASEDMMKTSWLAAKDLHGESDKEVATRLNNLAALLFEREEYERAEMRFREILSLRKALKQEPSEQFRTKSNLAMTLVRQGHLDEAERLCVEILTARLDANRDDPHDKNVARSRHNLAAVYFARGHFDDAEPLLRRALEARRQLTPGLPNTSVASTLNLLGKVLAGQGHQEEAEQAYRDALEMRLNQLGSLHRDVARTKKNLAALLARKDPDAALELVTEALPVFYDFRPDGWDAAEAKSIKGMILAASDRLETAERLMVEGYDRMVELAQGRHTYRSRLALERLLELSEALGRPRRLEKYRVAIGEQGDNHRDESTLRR